MSDNVSVTRSIVLGLPLKLEIQLMMHGLITYDSRMCIF